MANLHHGVYEGQYGKEQIQDYTEYHRCGVDFKILSENFTTEAGKMMTLFPVHSVTGTVFRTQVDTLVNT